MIEETLTILNLSMPASLNASSNERNSEFLENPVPLTKNIFFGTKLMFFFKD